MSDRRLLRRVLPLAARPVPLPPADPWMLVLESTLRDESAGRYSYVAPRAVATLVARGRRGVVRDEFGAAREGDTLALLDELTDGVPRPDDSDDVPWCGGPAGYIAYDFGRALERMPVHAREDLRLTDVALGVYDAVAIADHLAGTLTLVASGWPHAGALAESAAATRLDELQATLTRAAPLPMATARDAPTLDADLTRDDYDAAIARLHRAITAGDIYQANFAQRFRVDRVQDVRALYAALCETSPAPYAGMFVTPEATVLSASPELFLSRRGRRVVTRPIKGTRPRGATPDADAALVCELLASPKDRAEHVMIVDVERNDLGRVCEFGSVVTEALAALESFPSVHHLTSTIAGTLRADVGCGSMIAATFPGGSITGAPKLRAMELIDELEPVRRGVYSGVLGWFGWGGDCDLAITIRTLTVQDEVAHLWVGGGIVADSRAGEEYEETLVKGRSLARALGVTLDDARRAALHTARQS